MPHAAPRVCARCRQVAPAGQPCPNCHVPWENAPARPRGGRKWARIRLSRLKANPFCQWPGCTAIAYEVDHVVPRFEGGSLGIENTQSLCVEHHRMKSVAERQRAQAAARAKRTGGPA